MGMWDIISQKRDIEFSETGVLGYNYWLACGIYSYSVMMDIEIIMASGYS